MSRSTKSLDRYTRRARREEGRDFYQESWLTRARKAFERILRGVSYAAIGALYRNVPLRAKLRPDQVKSILIIPYGDALGDMIVASPVWRTIKRRIPHCYVGLVTSQRNEGLVKADPDIDECYRFEGRKDLKNWRSLRQARQRKYDVVLNLHFTHVTDYGFFANYIGPHATKLTGDHKRRDLYHKFFNLVGHRPRHRVALSAYSLDLLNDAIAFDPPLVLQESWPSLHIPETTQSNVDLELRKLGVTDRFIIIHQQAATSFREWGIDNSLALADKLIAADPSLHVFFTASRSYAETLTIPNAHNLHLWSGNDILEFAALIGRASVIVSPDTSTMHFASAMKTPIVLLLPDREHVPTEWLPVGVPCKLLAPALRHDPVSSIGVGPVLETTTAILDGSWHVTQTAFEGNVASAPFQKRNEDSGLAAILDEVTRGS